MVALLDTALNFLGLGGIPDRGAKIPDTRLRSANDARKLLQECLKEDNAGRSLERAIVKGCCDCNPPYPEPRPADRKWEANLNFGKGKGVMKRTGVPYFNLFARVTCFVECRTAYQPDNPDHNRWNASIALRFHNLLKRWKPGFNWGVQQISYWMRLHGVGFAFRDRNFDWRFRPVETGNVLVPKGSPSCLDKRIPYVFVRVPYRLTELWEKIKDEKAAHAAGANVTAVRNALKFGMKGMFGSPNGGVNDWHGRPWEEYERILNNHDYTTSFTDGDVIHCAVMLCLEYSGKISKFVFTEAPVYPTENPPTNPPPADTGDTFLFSDPNSYDEYLECLVPFFRDGGDGTWHSVRGYAQESFKHIEVENRLLCQGVNRAFLNSSVTLQFPSERARTQAQLQVRGTIITIPTGAEWKQLFTQGGVDDLVLMQRLLSNHLDNNIGIGTSRGMSRDDGRGETKTAREIDYTSANEGSIGEAEITNFYEQMDSLYNMMFTIAADSSISDEEAKRFQKECLADGVPKEALADMEYVRASRQNGYGSPEMAQIKFSQSKDLVAMLPEDGKMVWLRNAVTSIHGPQAAKELVPDQHIPTNDDWQAQVENTMFRDGVTPITIAGQNDVIHLQSHITDAKEFLAPFQDAADPNSALRVAPTDLQPALTYVQAAAPNLQDHIARLQQDPTRRKEATLFNDEFQNLIAFSGKLFVAYRRAQRLQRIEAEQAQSATALSALDQAKVESVRTSTALAAQKTQSTIENQRAKTVQGMALKEAKSRQEMNLKAREKAIEIPAEVVS